MRLGFVSICQGAWKVLGGVGLDGRVSHGRRMVLMCTEDVKSVRTVRPLYYTFSSEDVAEVRLALVEVATEGEADEWMDAVKRGEEVLEDLGWLGREELGELEETVLAARPRVLMKVKSPSRSSWYVLRVEDARHTLRPKHVERDRFLMNKKRPSRFGLSSVKRVPNTYNVQTMGCQMNKADSERMSAELERIGYTHIEDVDQASVVVFNTCSIRDHAEQKVYSYIGRHAQRKWVYPDIKLVVAGCVAQQEGDKLLRRVPELDLVMGPQYANRLGELLEHVHLGNQIAATEPIHIMEDLSKPRRESPCVAWINVIYGCLERCTYCVVPNTRGLEQSRTREAIRAEVESVVKDGYREVVLLGQNIDAYGRDLRPRDNFTNLLEFIHDIDGLERIRFTTSHPRYMTETLIKTCAKLEKVMPYFHVPFQSGDDEVLANMSRGYTADRYRYIIERIRRHIPDAAIAADAIVGFPGETEEQFQRTLQLMEEIKFDTVNTAAYSPRPATPAALWENQVPEDVKEDRLHRINHRTTIDAFERNQRYLGRIEEVLVEQVNPRNPAQVMGRTKTHKQTFFEGKIEELQGKLVDVRIDEIFSFSLHGQQVGVPR